MPRKPPPGLPTSKQILDFIEHSGQPAGKREIARAFGLSGHEKILLKSAAQGHGRRGADRQRPGRAFHKAGGVPRVTVLRVVSVDDGQVWAHAGKLACRNAAAAAARDRTGQAVRAGAQRSDSCPDRRGREGLRRPPDEEAGAFGGPHPGCRPPRGRAALSDAGRQEGTARAADFGPQGRAARRPGAGRTLGPTAADHGAGRRHPRRPIRAAQLQPDRDPQIWPARRIPHRGDRRGEDMSRSRSWARTART